ncbi:MAG TPA: DUF6152 family protein [Candidatus Acidoferrum sp.]|nr:DUF6152 family protein [Candidatus Acidoferrum sp.]
MFSVCRWKQALFFIFTAGASVLTAPAFAHHSQAAFDSTKEITIEGTVHHLDWRNPHIYLYVETSDGKGGKRIQQIEGLAVTQALVDGFDRNALTPGTHVLVRMNPNRNKADGTGRGLDVVTTADGKIQPMYRRNAIAPKLTPATGIAGKWAPSLAETGKIFGSVRGAWKLKPAAQIPPLPGACEIEPIPFVATIDELRSIAVTDKTAVFHFENSGDEADRVVYLDQKQHPANFKPSLFGHSIGHWEGDTLVIDTVGYAPNHSGLFSSIPAGAKKHTVERLTLTADRKQLRWELTMEDPDYLDAPATISMLWDHRPDLDFSRVPCEKEVSDRYLSD